MDEDQLSYQKVFEFDLEEEIREAAPIYYHFSQDKFEHIYTGEIDHEIDVSSLIAGYSQIYDYVFNGTVEHLSNQVVERAIFFEHVCTIIYEFNSYTNFERPAVCREVLSALGARFSIDKQLEIIDKISGYGDLIEVPFALLYSMEDSLTLQQISLLTQRTSRYIENQLSESDDYKPRESYGEFEVLDVHNWLMRKNLYRPTSFFLNN